MEELNKIMRARLKLKEIDTILYEIVRDYRVSGHPGDNKLMREMLSAFDLVQVGIDKKINEISLEAKKNHITGE